jgi:hypothetical protein
LARFEARDPERCLTGVPEEKTAEFAVVFAGCFTADLSFDAVNDIGVQLESRDSFGKTPGKELTFDYKGSP